MLRRVSRGEAALGRKTVDKTSLQREARDIVRKQATSIAQLADRIGDEFADAVDVLFTTPGHVVVFGLGKSGIIGQKMAATFASTGTPAFFVHATEALHGDLGRVTERDSAVLISYSGETEEVVKLMPHLRRIGVPSIGIVGKMESSLARSVDIALNVSVEGEVCPHGLAPTTSTLATLAMGDTIAVSLMKQRHFCATDFALNHPGGSLGRKLTMRCADVMRRSSLPICSPTDTVGECLVTMTQGRLGLAIVMSGPRLVGLVTDGDLRRAMQRHDNLLNLPVSEIMTLNPVTINEDTLFGDAHKRMQIMKLKALIVVDAKNKVCGVVDVFDQK